MTDLQPDEAKSLAEYIASRYVVAYEELRGKPYPCTQDGADACAFAVTQRFAQLAIAYHVDVLLDHSDRRFTVVCAKQEDKNP